MIYLKSCVSSIPGFDKGLKYGELVATKSLLQIIKSPNDDKFSTNFIEDRLGIKSVARSRFTLGLIEKAANDARKSKKRYALAHENSDLRLMLTDAVNRVFADDNDRAKVSFHIHITGTPMPNHGHFLSEVRKETHVAEGNYIPTQFLIKGCSGIYDAILIAEGMLSRQRKPANVLVTSDSNLAPFVGQVTSSRARPDNINEWLYPTIFAEGVGCALLSNERAHVGPSLRLDYSKVDMVTEENRVRVVTINDELSCFVDAKGVSKTYQEGMAKNIGYARGYAKDFDNVAAFLMHESNPMLLEKLIQQHDIPRQLVPKYSDKIGTLGPVSSFQLLETGIARITGNKQKILLNVIGELFSGVNSGCMGFEVDM